MRVSIHDQSAVDVTHANTGKNPPVKLNSRTNAVHRAIAQNPAALGTTKTPQNPNNKIQKVMVFGISAAGI